jgi:phenylacetate-CoA ligase
VLDITTGARLPDGETGHLVLSVDNPTYTMLRLATGDLAALAPGEPRRMLGPFGRVDASARVRGLLLHEAQVRRALGAHAALAAGYIEVSRVDGRDLLSAALVVTPDGEFAAVESAFRARFPELCRLSLDSVHQVAEAAGPLVRDLRPHAEKTA